MQFRTIAPQTNCGKKYDVYAYRALGGVNNKSALAAHSDRKVDKETVRTSRILAKDP